MLTRRSLFGLLGGALVAIGLDGPAKAAASYAEALERKIRKPKRIIIYVIDITAPPEIKYLVTRETSWEVEFKGLTGVRFLDQGTVACGRAWVYSGRLVHEGNRHIDFGGGLILSEGESLQVRTWKDNFEEYDLTEIRVGEREGEFRQRFSPSRHGAGVGAIWKRV